MEDDGILNKQSLLSQTAREYSYGYQDWVFDICIQKDQNNLFGMFAE